MKILYQFSNPDTLYAGRTISYGYKHAFTDLGHTFRFLLPDNNQKKLFLDYKPDIFITSFNRLFIKYLNFDLLHIAKKRGMKVFVNIPFWNSPISRFRINEQGSLKDSKQFHDLVSSNNYGDIYFNICAPNDLRMKGLYKKTGRNHKTLLLATDKTIIFPEYDPSFSADISYIGTNLPTKNDFFNKILFPLKNKYSIKIYGQDWSLFDKYLGFLQRIGQYYNIPKIKSLLKPSLQLTDERKIYSSSIISINVHERYQQKYGDLNERTFKIPISGGFEICDNVAGIENIFTPQKNIVIATNKNDWWDKITYYSTNTDKRKSIIDEGRKLVLKQHTYHNRVKTMLDWYREI